MSGSLYENKQTKIESKEKKKERRRNQTTRIIKLKINNMTNLGETLENQTTTNKTGNASSVACDTERLTNGNTSNKGNWLQSIPRRIRKLISKSNKKLEQVDRIYENIDEQNSTIDSATNIDGTDDSHLYSNVEYWNDEEVAMIRACSQMAKYVNPSHYLPLSRPLSTIIYIPCS